LLYFTRIQIYEEAILRINQTYNEEYEKSMNGEFQVYRKADVPCIQYDGEVNMFMKDNYV
jgi:hypothetical protein